MLYPSILAHTLNGALMLFALVFVFLHFQKIQALDTYRVLVLILLLSIVVGIHGLSHLGLEKEYQYVPFNLWNLPHKDMVCPCMKHKPSK